MIIGPKYKIARRLGAGVFEKTQTQKFAMSQAKKGKGSDRRSGPKSDYGIQMLEKQRARFSYALTEKQFSNYVKKALSKKGANQPGLLFQHLETRLDNVILRSGFAHTRMFARQMVSHGHVMVNGKKVTFPSFEVHVGDVIKMREASAKKGIFTNLDERLKNTRVPSWLKLDMDKKELSVQGLPKVEQQELIFDLGQVIEFYSR